MQGMGMLTLVAQAGTGGTGSMMNMMLPMIIIFGIMYVMMIRPQHRKEKERRQMIENLKSGTRVIFAGGLVGTVTNVKETTFVIKIADNVKVEVLRGSVSRILDKGDRIEEDEAK